jgi:hypothetical protein
MWWSARRALSRALDDLEQLRRDVGGLRYDLEKANERIQRLIWRTKASPTTTTADPSESVPDASGSGGSTNGDTAAASANAGRMPPTDPISARLLARRRRLPVNSGCVDHVVFEDGRPCPNCGKGAFAG